MNGINRFYYKKAKLQQLKGFCSVVEHSSIKKAGIELCLDSSTISLQIKALELDFDTKLIYKYNGKVLPTKNGLILYEKASKIIKLTDDLFDNLTFDKYKNCINIGISPIFAEYMVNFLYLYAKENSSIKINVYVISNDKLIESVLNNNIDIGFYPYNKGYFISEELNSVKFLEYEYYNISSNSNKNLLNIEDIYNNKIGNFINFENYFNVNIVNNIIKNTNTLISVPNLCLLDNKITNLLIEKTNKKNNLMYIYKKNNYKTISNFINFINLYRRNI